MNQQSKLLPNILQNIFWNREQGRLRTFWRILAELLLFVALSIGMELVSSSGGPVVLTATLRNLFYLGGGLLSFWLLARWFDRRPFADYGFHLNRGWWVDLGFGLTLGAVLMTGIFLTELLAGWITITGTVVSSGAVPFGLAFSILTLKYLAVGVCEELAFRGYLLKNLAEGVGGKRLGARAAIVAAFVISSVIFGLVHLRNANSSLTSTLLLILIGFLFSLPYLLTGELALSIGLHITWNLFQGPVFGFAISGGQPGNHWVGILQGGPQIWTGSAFGPEAGLVSILWVALGCGLIAAWVAWRHKHLALHQPLAAYSPEDRQSADLAPSLAG